MFGFEGTLIYCQKCKSPKVSFGKIVKLDKTETYPVKCNDCGAEGIVSETWVYESEESK